MSEASHTAHDLTGTEDLAGLPAESFSLYEFFAGAGMARLGLGQAFRCRFANDINPVKAAAYVANWGDAELRTGDVATLGIDDLRLPDTGPDTGSPNGSAPDLFWASFPCQDLSLAGKGQGISAGRSAAFWPFWDLCRNLAACGRAPRVIVLENVPGLLTARKGVDFSLLVAELVQSGYHFGALLLDAAHFLPQSRPRLFIVASHSPPPAWLIGPDHSGEGFGTHPALDAAIARLPMPVRDRHVAFSLPTPTRRMRGLRDMLLPDAAVAWRSAAQTAHVLGLMSPLHQARIAAIAASGRLIYGTLFRRTRTGPDGRKQQRAEARFDDCAGCLRTPAGGSSRQMLIRIEGTDIRTRFLAGRECARLMGLPDSFLLPGSAHDAQFVTGDGLAVPVVAHLAQHLLVPLSSAR